MGSILSSRRGINRRSPDRYIANVCVIGEKGVGKTCLCQRFIKEQCTNAGVLGDINNRFLASMGDYRPRWFHSNVKLNESNVEISFNTVSDQSDCCQMNRSCGGILLVYSVADKKSFKRLGWWIDEVKTRCEEDIPIVLVGNKCDEASMTVVDFPTAWDFASEKNLALVEVSAKDGTNVELAFVTLLAKMTLELQQRVHCGRGAIS